MPQKDPSLKYEYDDMKKNKNYFNRKVRGIQAADRKAAGNKNEYETMTLSHKGGYAPVHVEERDKRALVAEMKERMATNRRKKTRAAALDNPVAQATAGMLSFFHRYDTKKYGSEGAPLHDPCTVAWLLKPELFATRRCNLSVETESELTIGHTAVDFWHVTDRPHNVDWTHAVDADGFYELLTRRLARFGN